MQQHLAVTGAGSLECTTNLHYTTTGTGGEGERKHVDLHRGASYPRLLDAAQRQPLVSRHLDHGRWDYSVIGGEDSEPDSSLGDVEMASLRVLDP